MANYRAYGIGHGGAETVIAAPLIVDNLPARTSQYPVGQIIYLTSNNSFYMVGLGGALCLIGLGVGAGINTINANSGSTASPSGVVSIVGAGSVYTTGSGAVLTISSTAKGMVWNTGAVSGVLAPNNAYIITSGVQNFTLPLAADIGDSIEIVLRGGVSWQINLSGQTIQSIGAGGTPRRYTAFLKSNNIDNTLVKLVCTIANTDWNIENVVGSITGS